MTYQGRVKNGVIVLDEGSAAPPEGAAVRVEIVRAQQVAWKQTDGPLPTLAERFRSVIGMAKGLPPDASIRVKRGGLWLDEGDFKVS